MSFLSEIAIGMFVALSALVFFHGRLKHTHEQASIQLGFSYYIRTFMATLISYIANKELDNRDGETH